MSTMFGHIHESVKRGLTTATSKPVNEANELDAGDGIDVADDDEVVEDSVKTLREMIQSSEYQSYMSDKLGNNLFMEDPERADRIQKAAEEGADGSFHEEVISDWEDYLSNLDVSDETKERIQKEIDDTRAYHQQQGTLWQQVG